VHHGGLLSLLSPLSCGPDGAREGSERLKPDRYVVSRKRDVSRHCPPWWFAAGAM
jgi:hypothetical protein